MSLTPGARGCLQALWGILFIIALMLFFAWITGSEPRFPGRDPM